MSGSPLPAEEHPSTRRRVPLPALELDVPNDNTADRSTWTVAGGGEAPAVTRSTSATSSLDPYYFQAGESPVPPVPQLSTTPDNRPLQAPVTPGRDPAAIDRRGLVGVGELATPRWTKDTSDHHQQRDDDDDDDDPPDSPWTIEAVDGEGSDRGELRDETLPEPEPIPRSVRTRPSITSESGGEEILYPRSAPAPAPPTAFAPEPRRAKKRTSDEFEMDQHGTLVSKHGKDKMASARKHQSLGARPATSPRDTRTRERRESTGLTINSGKASATPGRGRHSRQLSASSSSSNQGDRRPIHATDFSHLPPSPSSTSIRQFLKQTTSPSIPKPPLATSVSKEDAPMSAQSPSVAHSLLRGTQEGWSGMDDEATAEALRKLDGLTGKSARARASVGSFHRLSRSGTPAKSNNQWEGVEGTPKRRPSTREGKQTKEGASTGLSTDAPLESGDLVGSAVSSDEQPPSGPEKTAKKAGPNSNRSSMNGKRASASSTMYTGTPTTGSRDSTSMSVSTSVTSMSGLSSRHSINKNKRNSAGSDISNSSDATSLKDRVASIASNGDFAEEPPVPPVPPLPKDLTNYRSPPPSSTGLTFPTLPSNEERRTSHDSEAERALPSEPAVPRTSTSSVRTRQSQQFTPDSQQPQVVKTPSKKWSFTNALKLSGSPSSSSPKSNFPISPRGVTFGQQLRKSISKDHGLAPSTASSQQQTSWSPRSDAMQSSASIASVSSVGSFSRTPGSSGKASERGAVPSRSGTDSSASNNTTSVQAQAPLSPTSSVRRGQSKRLTPSSIPFFRRSSSQSMQLTSNSATYAGPTSPTIGGGNFSATDARFPEKGSTSPDSSVYNTLSTSVPGTASRKSSMLSLGLPALLKSSSRRSLHSDSKEAAKETLKARELSKETEQKEKDRPEKPKKDDKDRSESRISSVLMGRKRGKTLSSTEPKKPRSPVSMPPMHVQAIEPATAQRVARLKPNGTSPASSSSSGKTTTASSRATAQTVSSLQKQSDASLRSNRSQLPTIAGSPSVSTVLKESSKEAPKEGPAPPTTLGNSASNGLPKETPTKIPRISSRTSGFSSPSLKSSSIPAPSRRTSVNATSSSSSNTVTATSSTNNSPVPNEFGVMENGESQARQTKATATATKRHSVRASPSMGPTARPARQSTIGASSSTASGSGLPRNKNRESMTFGGLRKSSTGSASASTNNNTTTMSDTSSHHHRFSALSPSKGLKLLSPKISLPSARSSHASSSQRIEQSMSPSSSRQSLTSPSPSPSLVDDEERLGDEEMMAYIRRQQTKKLNAGASQAELEDLLRFPEPIRPATPLSPSTVLNGSQSQYLSDYERKEILDYPNVYAIGSRSRKKMATPDNSSNNFGYDDERGDYLVVNKDHLAYRYEVVDTLGKGSFGQVLNCRDHCTGESVAIKIIRNKKRFHHQALVEIKILDNLRKWDSEEKHHVIKMTEHFYFRNHLCIAMELLSINLYELIKANGFVGFTTNLIRRFTSQMLLSLSLMRHHRIVHCDLKPENVLLKHPAKSALKVIDFGSSCFEHEKIYTYIQSRFYRSPEVILGMNYHMAIDMWSLGCILAELYTGFPIFPGENEQEQLSCIMEVLGAPEKDFVNRSSRKKLFFDPSGTPRAVINSKGRRRRPGTKSLAQVLRCSDEDFVDFISKCLMWDPERRIKPQAALRHPFVTAGRRTKSSTSAATTARNMLSSSSLGGSRTKQTVHQTPKKSEIGAPTPLTARSSRVNGSGANPTTPSNSTHASTLGSTTRSYRASQSRTLSGFAV